MSLPITIPYRRTDDDESKHIGAATWESLISGDRMFSDDFYDVGLGAALRFSRLSAYRDICSTLGASESIAGHLSMIVMAYRGVDVSDINHVVDHGVIRADFVVPPHHRITVYLRIIDPKTGRLMCGYICPRPDGTEVLEAKKEIIFSRYFLRGVCHRGDVDLVVYHILWRCRQRYDSDHLFDFSRGIEHASDSTIAAAIAIIVATSNNRENIFSYVVNMQWNGKSHHRHIGPKTAAVFATWITSPGAAPAMDVKFYRESVLGRRGGREYRECYWRISYGDNVGPGIFLRALAAATAAIDPRYSVELEFECKNCWAFDMRKCDCDESETELYGPCEECQVYGERCRCNQCFGCCGHGGVCKCDE